MINITKGSGGLYTQSSPTRSQYTEDGIYDLSACLNIDISDKFRISRRRAVNNKLNLNAHSLHPINDKYCLFVSGNNLNLLLPSLTEYKTIATVTPGHKLSCCVVDDIAYWVNGVDRGKIIDYINYEWVANAPDIVSSNQTRVFYDPPRGNFLGYYNGRMYIASGKEVWYSDAYSPNIFSLGDSFLPFESAITMIRPVASGIYISESDKTWFLFGDGPENFIWKVVDNFPALPYSDKKAIGAMIENKWTSIGGSEVAFWLTNQGLMYGSSDGSVINMSNEKIDLIGVATTGAILIDGSSLIGNFI